MKTQSGYLASYALVMLATLLAGCGAKQTPAAAPVETTEPEKPATTTPQQEARKNLRELAMLVLARSEKESTPNGASHKCGPAAPLMPPLAKDGSAVQASLMEWHQGAWNDIGFSVDHPSPFSYGVELAPDDTHCVVYALGPSGASTARVRYELRVFVGADRSLRLDSDEAREILLPATKH